MPGHLARIAAGRGVVTPPQPGVPAPERRLLPPTAVFWPPAWPKRRKIRAFCAAIATANPSSSPEAGSASPETSSFSDVNGQSVLQPCPCAIINPCLTGRKSAAAGIGHRSAQKTGRRPWGAPAGSFPRVAKTGGRPPRYAVCRHVGWRARRQNRGASPRPRSYGESCRTLQVCNVRPEPKITPRRAAARPSADHGRRNPGWISTPRCPVHR